MVVGMDAELLDSIPSFFREKHTGFYRACMFAQKNQPPYGG